MQTILVEVSIQTAPHQPPQTTRLNVPSTETIGRLIRRLLELDMEAPTDEWELRYLDLLLPHDGVIGTLVPVDGAGVVHLTLRSWAWEPLELTPAAGVAPVETVADSASGDLDLGLDASCGIAEDDPESVACVEEAADYEEAASSYSAADGAHGVVELDDFLAEDDSEAPVASSRPMRMPAKQAAQAQYQATVRYNNRMNPDRVYPFIVALTREMVERIQRQNTEQRVSDPFVADAKEAIEVEPVLPGCHCYPPRQTVRLNGQDHDFKFHIVPQVLGPVTGAKVLVRQNHRTLATVELDARVTQRTMVFVCGLATFALPFASSILRHFGLDFESQQQDGFSLYIEIARTVFQSLSPTVLMLVLGSATGVFYWLTRPSVREQFFDVNFIKSADLLKKIISRKETDPDGAADDLLDLLKAHPENQSAWLQYGQWHYETEDFEAALHGYRKAMDLGPVQAKDYLRASLSASKLGQLKTALGILMTAEAKLPAKELTGVIFFNMGCYHARLGSIDQVIPCLQRAVQAGYRKLESYLKDKDLDPVRSRPEFQALLHKVRQQETH